MRYRWDGFLGHDMETAGLGQVFEPELDVPSGPWSAPPVLVIENTFPPADQALPVTIPDIAIPPLREVHWPIIPEAPNPYIPETSRVFLPAPSPSPTGPNNAGIFAEIGAGISSILTPIVKTGLPLLERYGMLRPVRGPSRLPLPGEPGYAYAMSVYGPRGLAPTFASLTPWLIGGGLVLLVVTASRGRRRR